MMNTRKLQQFPNSFHHPHPHHRQPRLSKVLSCLIELWLASMALGVSLAFIGAYIFSSVHLWWLLGLATILLSISHLVVRRCNTDD